MGQKNFTAECSGIFELDLEVQGHSSKTIKQAGVQHPKEIHRRKTKL